MQKESYDERQARLLEKARQLVEEAAGQGVQIREFMQVMDYAKELALDRKIGFQ